MAERVRSFIGVHSNFELIFPEKLGFRTYESLAIHETGVPEFSNPGPNCPFV
jgi:hypothetical protein